MYSRDDFTRYLRSLYGIGHKQADEYMGDRKKFDDLDLIACYNRYRTPPSYKHRQQGGKWRPLGEGAYTTKRYTVYNSKLKGHGEI